MSKACTFLFFSGIVLIFSLSTSGNGKRPQPLIIQMQEFPTILKTERSLEMPPTIRPNSDPLKQAVELGGRLLLSNEDRLTKERLLSSEQLLNQVIARLEALKVNSITDEQVKTRLEAIDYLGAAAFWKENPLRQRVLDRTVKILEQDITKADLSQEARQVFAGDLIELYTVLLQADSERARYLYERSSENQKKLFQFATNLVTTSRKGSLNEVR